MHRTMCLSLDSLQIFVHISSQAIRVQNAGTHSK